MSVELSVELLYDAATNSLASNASSENTWTKMVLASRVFGNYKEMRTELKRTEKRIKGEYGIAAMPVAWRSAKSVVLQAMQHGIALFDGNDIPVGKTSVQKALAALKKTVLSVGEQAIQKLYFVEKAWPMMTTEETTLAAAILLRLGH